MIEPAEANAETWVSQTDLAKLRGVSEVSISKRMGRLASEGLLDLRRHRGRVLCRLAQWDRVTGERTDPERLAVIAGQDRAPPAAPAEAPAFGEPGLTAVRTVTERYRGELAKLEYEKQIGNLIEASELKAAVEKAAELIVREYDRLPQLAEDLAAAVAVGGVAGLREKLKGLTREMRSAAARAFATLASERTDDDDQATPSE